MLLGSLITIPFVPSHMLVAPTGIRITAKRISNIPSEPLFRIISIISPSRFKGFKRSQLGEASMDLIFWHGKRLSKQDVLPDKKTTLQKPLALLRQSLSMAPSLTLPMLLAQTASAPKKIESASMIGNMTCREPRDIRKINLRSWMLRKLRIANHKSMQA